ncbi:Cysteinyl-tRNA synthetase [Hordeum vulgare]|nr:Cysteinyl-tRNA synthetase [Hordeum vulgare]
MNMTGAQEDEVDQPSTGFNLAEADAEVTVAQAEEMAEQHAILESIQDELEVSANHDALKISNAACMQMPPSLTGKNSNINYSFAASSLAIESIDK